MTLSHRDKEKERGKMYRTKNQDAGRKRTDPQRGKLLKLNFYKMERKYTGEKLKLYRPREKTRLVIRQKAIKCLRTVKTKLVEES